MIVIFTDLDGTLLDAEDYSFDPAAQALAVIGELRIPLVIISSKTCSEIEPIRFDLKNEHPFVTENGGGIFVPEGYFPFPIPYSRRRSQYLIIDIGIPYTNLNSFLDRMVSDCSLPIRGFHSMSVDEVSRNTGLSFERAACAKEREYDEPFIFEGDALQSLRLDEEVRKEGLSLTRGGRFHHISGSHDKGIAAKILIEYYRLKYPGSVFVGLGDAPNDFSFLTIVDHPVLVQRSDGRYENEGIDISNLHYSSKPGPAGWGEAVLELTRFYNKTA